MRRTSAVFALLATAALLAGCAAQTTGPLSLDEQGFSVVALFPPAGLTMGSSAETTASADATETADAAPADDAQPPDLDDAALFEALYEYAISDYPADVIEAGVSVEVLAVSLDGNGVWWAGGRATPSDLDIADRAWLVMKLPAGATLWEEIARGTGIVLEEAGVPSEVIAEWGDAWPGG